MALRREEPDFLSVADQYLNRGVPTAPPVVRSTAPAPPREPTPEEIEQVRRERSLARSSESEKALNQGLAGLESSGYAARGLARIGLGNEAGGIEDIQRSQEITDRAAAEGPRVQSLGDIEDAGSALEYARNLGVQQIPNIALTAVTGGTGGLARGAVTTGVRAGAQSALRTRLAREVAEETGETVVSRATQRAAAERAAQQFAGRATTPLFSQSGARVGAAAGGAFLQTGQTAGAVLDEESTDSTGEKAAKAAAGAVLTGSLEALPVMALFRRYGLGGAEEAAQQAVTGGLVSRVAKSAAKQGLTESATEVAQTLGEVATHKWVNDNVELLGDEALNQYVNAAVGGAVGGAVFGAPAGFRGVADNNIRQRVSDGMRSNWETLSEKLRPREGPPPAAAAAPSPDAPTPAGPAASAFAAVSKKATDLRDQFVRDVKPKVEQGLSEVQRQYNEVLERLKKESEANLLAEFEAEPFNFTDVNGEAVVSGTPMASFANKDILPQMREAGLTGMSGHLAAALPDVDTALRLQTNGGLSAAERAFRGDDPDKFSDTEIDGLRSYMNSLPADKATQFRRYLTTQEALRKGGFIQTDENGAAVGAQITRPAPNTVERAPRVGDTEAARSLSEANRIGAATERQLVKAVRGAPISATRGLDNRWWTLPDDKGVRREVNLASALRAMDQDTDFQEATKNFSAHDRQVAKLARVVQAAQDAGVPIDPEAIRSVPLNRSGSVVIPQRVIDSLKQGLNQRSPAPSRTGPWATDPSAQSVDRAIDDNVGQADRRDIVETVRDPNERLGSDAVRLTPIKPGSGSPSGTEDTRYALPREDQTDRTALREERAQFDPAQGSPRQQLDRILVALTGETPENDVRDRRRLFAKASARKDLTQSQRKALRDAADAYAEDRYARTVAANNKAVAAWKADKNPQTKRAMDTARAALDRARAELDARQRRDAARTPTRPVVVPRGPGKRNLERRAKTVAGKKARVAAKLRGDMAANNADAQSAANQPSKPAAQISNRSRRELFQEQQEWIDKPGISETRRLEELIRIENEISALGNEIVRVAREDIKRRLAEANTPAKTFNAIREALDDGAVTNTEQALRAVREHASDAQKRLIDTVLQMDGVKNTSFELLFDAYLPNGVLNATFFSPKQASLEGKIVIKLPMLDATNDKNVDPVHTLLHEAIHAMTSYAEQTNPAVSKALKRLLDHARAQATAQGVDPDTWYGLSETQEFVAEAFSNPAFQKLLEGMPAANTDLFQNLWQQFKDFIAKLLGVKGAEATALDEVIAIGLEAGRQKQLARVEEVRRILTTGAAFNSASASAATPSSYFLTLPPEARVKLAAAFAPPLLGRADKKSAWNRIRELAPVDIKPLLDTSDRGIQLSMDLGIAYALEGKLDLSKEHRTAVGRIWDAISETLKIPSANVYAKQIIKDIADGAVGRGYDPVKRTLKNDTAAKITKFVNTKVTPVADALLKNIDTRIREQGIPAFNKMATLLSQRTGEFRSNNERSFRQRVSEQQGQWLEKLGSVITGITPENQVVLIRALQSQKALPPKYKNLQPVYDGLRKWLDDFHKYSTDAGVQLGKLEQYFPVAMDAAEVAKRRDAFFELHRAKNFDKPIRERFKKWVQVELDAENKKKRKNQKRIDALEGRLDQLDRVEIDELIGELYDMAIYGGKEHYIAGVNFVDEAHKPAFSNAKPRTSDFIFTHGTPEQKAAFSKFQDNNLSRVLITYANRGVRRAEWERMNLSLRLSNLKDEAVFEGATPAQLQMFDDYVNQIMGVYNDNWNPVIARIFRGVDRVFETNLAQLDFQKFKQVQGALMTYNNVRLLPLAIVSSLVDPLASVVRSGTAAGSWTSFREAVRAFRNKEGNDGLRAMAEQMGVVERQGIQEALAYMYGNIYDPNSTSAKINNTLFRLNGLEAMTRFSRLMALASGHRFLLRHAAGQGESARYLRELDLKPEDIKPTADGRFVELNPKTQEALRRFVDESVVRPHAGQRPSWHNDPNFALAAQYKGYLYAFYETVLKRVGVELQNGNPAVLAPLVLYLPITAMAEMGRDVAQGDDEDKEMDYYVKKSLERSGLLGARHGVVTEATDNIRFGNGVLGNIAGPTGQQLGEAYDVLNGQAEISDFAVEALPGQALYKNWGE